MKIFNSIQKKYGNDSELLLNDTIANKCIFSGDYRNLSIKRMKLEECYFKGAKFNNAAVTGSNFKNCQFTKCSMDQGDFEYCDFYNCEITSKKPISIAFDNSNFIDSNLHDLTFYSSTFSNSFFEGTKFHRVKFKFSTLESASFQNCIFDKVDFNNLNLDYTEFKNPHFEDCTLPLSQVVYASGLLQCLMNRESNVALVDNGKLVTVEEYVDKILPELLKSYLDMKDSKKIEIYFPLINILLAYNHFEIANEYLNKALYAYAQIQDLRMIKHICRLINNNDYYSTMQKRKLYKRICSFFQPDLMISWQLKNYSRHIGDIKYILLYENNFPTLVAHILTNITKKGIERIGIFINDVFHLSDKCKSEEQHDIHFEISRNSPIIISIEFTENLENLIYFLKELMFITKINDKSKLIEDNENKLLTLPIRDEIAKYKNNYRELGLSLSLLSYHFENWKSDFNDYFHEAFKNKSYE